ncbi:MAG: hypothetical protein IT162_04300, partial [Bryobacterales bacterium]|nr:hypothetical protein [Bryobacterales bacterium]
MPPPPPSCILVLALMAGCAGTALAQAGPLAEAEPLIQKEDFTAAANVLAQALRQHPHSAEVLYRLGYVEFRQRKLIAARG